MTIHETGRGAQWRQAARLRAADWLSLAAAPSLAAMALLTRLPASAPAMICMGARDAAPLGGMAAMYLLMSVFHLAPWLRLFTRPRGAARRG